jgi:hypothetical protein
MAKPLDPAQPPPERIERATNALREGEPLGELLEPAQWLWMAASLAAARDVDALKRIEAATTDKGLHKGLGRLYHRLRSVGVEVDRSRAAGIGPTGSSDQVSRPGGICSVASLCGAFVATSVWSVPGQGSLFFEATFGGPQIEANLSWPAPGALRDWQRHAVQDGFYPTPVAYQDHMVGLVLQRLRAQGSTMSPGFMSVLPILGHLAVGPAHPLDATLAERGVALPTSVSTSGDLFDLPFFLMLRYRRRWLEIFAERLAEIDASPLVLSQIQEQERIQSVIRATVTEVKTSVGVTAIALALRHTGMLALLQGGLEREAATLAKVAAFLEEGVEPADIPLFTRPFELLLIGPESGLVDEVPPSTILS